MGLTGHRRTSSHKRRRASHFALTKPTLAKDKSGNTHLSHRVAPGATEYNGIKIHRKGAEKKLEKLLKKSSKPEKKSSKPEKAEHGHEGHNH
jgi:ribosomal protein L32